MGGCLSRRSDDIPTAKLAIIEEEGIGLIKEFPEHVKVEEILREKPGFFVCHADSMRYNEYVYPLSAEQELRVGHVYFMLPVTALRHPLSASDMAALAVKASAAMERSRRRRRHNKSSRRHRCKITPSVIMMEQEEPDNNPHELISSSSSWRGESMREGYDSETMECRKRMELGLRQGPVRYKLQRVASGRKRVNGVPLRRKLSTIHEEAFT